MSGDASEPAARWFRVLVPEPADVPIPPPFDFATAGACLRSFCAGDSAALETAYAAHATATAAHADDVAALRRPPAGGPVVLVRGMLWEAAVGNRTCAPCYWTAPAEAIVRGTWFWSPHGSARWSPLSEGMAGLVDAALEQRPWASPKLAGRVALTASLHLQCESPCSVWLCADSAAAAIGRVASAVTAGYAGGEPGYRLRRGWDAVVAATSSSPPAPPSAASSEDEYDEWARATPPTHLVLLVHGMGARLAAPNQLLAEAAAARVALRALAASHPVAGAPPGRVDVLPVLWRAGAAVTGDALVRDCTLPGAGALRSLFNLTVVDALYYLTPRHGHDFVASLAARLNAAVASFWGRQPGITPQVSILAHSLGAVVAYDLMCHQPAVPAPAGATGALGREYPRLAFGVDALCLVGSPLALFLALRTPEVPAPAAASGWVAVLGAGAPVGIPACRLFLNVFSPWDCLAYRLEPLIHRGWATRPPVVVPHAATADGWRPAPAPGGYLPSLAGVMTLASTAAAAAANAAAAPLLAALQRAEAMGGGGTAGGRGQGTAESDESESSAATLAPPAAHAALAALAGDCGAVCRGVEPPGRVESGATPGLGPPPRVDYVLQEPADNPLLAALGAHTGYWRSEDALLLLYRAISSGPR